MNAKTSEQVVPGSQGAQSRLAKFVTVDEQYGAHVIRRFVEQLPPVQVAMDVGAGSGRDVELVRSVHPSVRTIAIDFSEDNLAALRLRNDVACSVNLERDRLPQPAESVDLVIANQVLEHVKEIFWIWHEVSRVLRVGGHFIVGVPNIASLHNRGLLLLGQHPTQWKSYSAHVRPFSKPDTVRFTQVCFPDGYTLVDFQGAQFYPFPRSVSRVLCSVWPSAAAFVFFLFRKVKPYTDEFLRHPRRAALESNFYVGPDTAG